MFRVSQHPSSGVLKGVTAASETGHNKGIATSLQRGPIATPDLTTLYLVGFSLILIFCILCSEFNIHLKMADGQVHKKV